MAIVIPGVSRIYRRLSVLPMIGSRVKIPDMVMNPESSGPFAESFRLLAINCNAALKGRSSRGIVVMSAFPEDGRSLIAANLASALAEHGGTILHDGDSRATTAIGKMFGANGASKEGWFEDVRARDTLPESLRDTVQPGPRPRLWLSAALSSQPRETRRLGRLVGTASDAGIATVVDSPPATVSSEAFSLAQEIGNVIYVVRRVAHDVEVHRQVHTQLQRLDVEIIGLVTNEA